MAKETLLTKEGKAKLKEELYNLKTKKRKEIASEIEQAREYGDLSENVAYEEAINRMAFLEGRIQEIEKTLANAKVVNKKNNTQIVDVGCQVLVKDLSGLKTKYYIVTRDESDPSNYKITIDSPIGSALYQRSKGEKVLIATPQGKQEFFILGIE
jgi:transcription elongation factor GreA